MELSQMGENNPSYYRLQYFLEWRCFFLTNLKTIKGESILEYDIYNKRGKKTWFDTRLASCIKKPIDS